MMLTDRLRSFLHSILDLLSETNFLSRLNFAKFFSFFSLLFHSSWSFIFPITLISATFQFPSVCLSVCRSVYLSVRCCLLFFSPLYFSCSFIFPVTLYFCYFSMSLYLACLSTFSFLLLVIHFFLLFHCMFPTFVSRSNTLDSHLSIFPLSVLLICSLSLHGLE